MSGHIHRQTDGSKAISAEKWDREQKKGEIGSAGNREGWDVRRSFSKQHTPGSPGSEGR